MPLVQYNILKKLIINILVYSSGVLTTVFWGGGKILTTWRPIFLHICLFEMRNKRFWSLWWGGGNPQHFLSSWNTPLNVKTYNLFTKNSNKHIKMVINKRFFGNPQNPLRKYATGNQWTIIESANKWIISPVGIISCANFM